MILNELNNWNPPPPLPTHTNRHTHKYLKHQFSHFLTFAYWWRYGRVVRPTNRMTLLQWHTHTGKDNFFYSNHDQYFLREWLLTHPLEPIERYHQHVGKTKEINLLWEVPRSIAIWTDPWWRHQRCNDPAAEESAKALRQAPFEDILVNDWKRKAFKWLLSDMLCATRHSSVDWLFPQNSLFMIEQPFAHSFCAKSWWRASKNQTKNSDASCCSPFLNGKS